ncbi:hypothetical protein [Microbacterium lacticum]|uniref:Tfp pilus assembly protein PilN n=2 Tax=Microbacterium lacticum TaxID=33885 RepID=A0A4Y3USB3_9MICO|nr:hypothetical protein [Microbacterium lacticum]TQN00073.1 hypothetical protein FHX68_0142 [Microbacterium lacticum]GEB95725.1 hypothetical protein MLA01_19440 [Microbacterium lacticum]GGI68694.1 hypothetical protein GCM10009724_19740 [Microbacterium lacticum]
MTTEMTERRQRHRPDPSDVELDEPAPTHTPVYAIARVDLVPPIVEARRRHAATERKLMAGMLALLVAVVAAGLAMAALAMSAESTLSAERTRAQVLLNEQKKYSEVSSIKAHLGGYDGAELAALYSEARWSRLMTELDAVLPADVSLATESITVKVVADDAASIESTGLDAPGVIEISFTANAARFDSPTPLLDALSRLTGYVSATVEAVASNESGYLITGVVQLGADALGGTARTDALDADKLTALHEQLEQAATTSPTTGTETTEATDGADATSAGE